MNIRIYSVCNGVKIKATNEGITVTSVTGKKTYFDIDGNLIKKKSINCNCPKNNLEYKNTCIQCSQNFSK